MVPCSARTLACPSNMHALCARYMQVMEPHYVRCIKPNSLNQPLLFEGANVLQQLRCGGVCVCARASRACEHMPAGWHVCCQAFQPVACVPGPVEPSLVCPCALCLPFARCTHMLSSP